MLAAVAVAAVVAVVAAQPDAAPVLEAPELSLRGSTRAPNVLVVEQLEPTFSADATAVVRCENRGSEVAEAVRVALLYDGLESGSSTVGPVAAGATAPPVTLFWQAHNDGGEHELEVSCTTSGDADPSNDVFLFALVYEFVASGVDLSVGAVALNQAPVTPETVAVVAQEAVVVGVECENIGTLDTADAFSVGYKVDGYFRDTVEVTSGVPAGGATAPVFATVTIDADDETHEIEVICDVAGMVDDLDRDNNAQTVRVRVEMVLDIALVLPVVVEGTAIDPSVPVVMPAGLTVVQVTCANVGDVDVIDPVLVEIMAEESGTVVASATGSLVSPGERIAVALASTFSSGSTYTVSCVAEGDAVPANDQVGFAVAASPVAAAFQARDVTMGHIPVVDGGVVSGVPPFSLLAAKCLNVGLAEGDATAIVTVDTVIVDDKVSPTPLLPGQALVFESAFPIDPGMVHTVEIACDPGTSFTFTIDAEPPEGPVVVPAGRLSIPSATGSEGTVPPGPLEVFVRCANIGTVDETGPQTASVLADGVVLGPVERPALQAGHESLVAATVPGAVLADGEPHLLAMLCSQGSAPQALVVQASLARPPVHVGPLSVAVDGVRSGMASTSGSEILVTCVNWGSEAAQGVTAQVTGADPVPLPDLAADGGTERGLILAPPGATGTILEVVCGAEDNDPNVAPAHVVLVDPDVFTGVDFAMSEIVVNSQEYEETGDPAAVLASFNVVLTCTNIGTERGEGLIELFFDDLQVLSLNVFIAHGASATINEIFNAPFDKDKWTAKAVCRLFEPEFDADRRNDVVYQEMMRLSDDAETRVGSDIRVGGQDVVPGGSTTVPAHQSTVEFEFECVNFAPVATPADFEVLVNDALNRLEYGGSIPAGESRRGRVSVDLVDTGAPIRADLRCGENAPSTTVFLIMADESAGGILINFYGETPVSHGEVAFVFGGGATVGVDATCTNAGTEPAAMSASGGGVTAPLGTVPVGESRTVRLDLPVAPGATDVFVPFACSDGSETAAVVSRVLDPCDGQDACGPAPGSSVPVQQGTLADCRCECDSPDLLAGPTCSEPVTPVAGDGGQLVVVSVDTSGTYIRAVPLPGEQPQTLVLGSTGGLACAEAPVGSASLETATISSCVQEGGFLRIPLPQRALVGGGQRGGGEIEVVTEALTVFVAAAGDQGAVSVEAEVVVDGVVPGDDDDGGGDDDDGGSAGGDDDDDGAGNGGTSPPGSTPDNSISASSAALPRVALVLVLVLVLVFL